MTVDNFSLFCFIFAIYFVVIPVDRKNRRTVHLDRKTLEVEANHAFHFPLVPKLLALTAMKMLSSPAAGINDHDM